jgi:putative phosphoesterase
MATKRTTRQRIRAKVQKGVVAGGLPPGVDVTDRAAKHGALRKLEEESAASVRLGVISDVHGDYAALQESLAQLDRLGVAEVVCAGDLLDWGPSPGRCIELLASRGISCVRGNHDFVDAGGGTLDPLVYLSRPALAFLDAMPRSWERTIAGVRVAVWHGSPGDEMRGIHADRADVGAFLTQAAADVLVVGHTHVPMRLVSPKGSIVNPGSILRQPPTSERIPASGTFGILELPSRRFTVHRASDGAEVTPTGNVG